MMPQPWQIACFCGTTYADEEQGATPCPVCGKTVIDQPSGNEMKTYTTDTPDDRLTVEQILNPEKPLTLKERARLLQEITEDEEAERLGELADTLTTHLERFVFEVLQATENEYGEIERFADGSDDAVVQVEIDDVLFRCRFKDDEYEPPVVEMLKGRNVTGDIWKIVNSLEDVAKYLP